MNSTILVSGTCRLCHSLHSHDTILSRHSGATGWSVRRGTDPNISFFHDLTIRKTNMSALRLLLMSKVESMSSLAENSKFFVDGGYLLRAVTWPVQSTCCVGSLCFLYSETFWVWHFGCLWWEHGNNDHTRGIILGKWIEQNESDYNAFKQVFHCTATWDRLIVSSSLSLAKK